MDNDDADDDYDDDDDDWTATTAENVWSRVVFRGRANLSRIEENSFGRGRDVCLLVGWLLNVPATC